MRVFLATFLFLCLVLVSTGALAYEEKCDPNEDGFIDEEDILILQAHWKTTGPEVIIDLSGLPEDAIPLSLVRIPAGSFAMGSVDDATWSECYPCEQPVHDVTIEYDFYMGKYEVTQAQWEIVMGTNPSYFNTCGVNCPVDDASWADCQAFIAALNGVVSEGTFRMPSEAEWEYACRAGTTTRFYFGDSDCLAVQWDPCELRTYAWWHSGSGFTTHPVGLKPPNAFGLYDMHGNVYEWVQDRYHYTYDGAPVDGSAWEAGGVGRMVRGGAWSSVPRTCRSSTRSRVNPDGPPKVCGLRLVWTP
jgi:formylglycine-generating enzyme required for sulfatase activity